MYVCMYVCMYIKYIYIYTHTHILILYWSLFIKTTPRSIIVLKNLCNVTDTKPNTTKKKTLTSVTKTDAVMTHH